MLNTAERFKILKYIGHCCTIGCLPAVVDLSSWELLRVSGRRRWLSLTYFGFFALHVMYKLGTLLKAWFSYSGRPPLHQLIIHGTVALSGLFIIFWYYQMYVKDAGTFGIFLRMTLTGNIGGTTIVGEETKNCVSRLKAYTLQDFVAINLPYMAAPVVAAVIGTGIHDPTLQLLLYAGLPAQFQSWLSLTVLLFEEIRFLLIFGAVALSMWILQLISFDLINNQLKHLIDSVERITNRQKLLSTYKRLRHIQLYVTITNVVNRYIIFSWKVLCIGMSITVGYAAIAHFGDYPVFGVMYYLILFDGMFIYIVSYDKAFGIPELFKKTTEMALLQFHGGRREDMRIFKRQMRSIPRVGIKVGDFHMLERESTPVFLNYILNNIVSMLVACKN